MPKRSTAPDPDEPGDREDIKDTQDTKDTKDTEPEQQKAGPDAPDPEQDGPDSAGSGRTDPDEELDEEEPDPDQEDEEGLDGDSRHSGRRSGTAGAAAGGEPAWRAALRGSRFGQVAVLAVAAFAIAIAAWWAVGPQDAGQAAQAEGAAVTQVDVDGVQQAPMVGDTAPAFSGTDTSSQEVVLDPEAMDGRPVWLMFVATWCTGCRTEMPDVQEAAAAHGEEVRVIVVYVGEDASTVSAYSQRVGNDLTEVPDRSQAVSAAYGVMGVPSHFFIDSEGTVRQTSVGLLTPDQMAQALDGITRA
ncbi:TlpA family protein disulfide reductase [Actinomyces sp. 2119]|uniref:TlpA family protein disulfide reductase n=1 Tax=Actinomyces sp. 2119 TaxID=2321393 RepID=UPI000E6BB589|nr:TlpA disulfide reductase family protein [Actinomyces sp. 2119]RJF43946.1 TlpA family protein disulfide reductase [Actinomyces sp. 2119]